MEHQEDAVRNPTSNSERRRATPKNPALRQEPDCDIAVDPGTNTVLIPNGCYRAIFIHHNTKFMFNSWKVFLWFRIVELGEHFGKEVYAAYRADISKAGKLKIGRRSNLFVMLGRVLEIRLRPDRVSFRDLKHCVLLISTRTVTKDYRQRLLPEWERYSIVDDVLRKETS